MKALGFVLGLHKSNDFWPWCLRNECVHGIWGGLEYQGNAEHLKKLHDDIYEKGSRIRIADLPEGTFPENFVTPNLYQIEEAADIASLYDDIKEQLDEDEDDDRLAITKILDERRAIEFYKVDLFADLAREYIEEGNSVVVFVNFKDTLDQLFNTMFNSYGIHPLTVYGGQKPETRQRNIELFQTDKIRMMIVTIQSGGVGINLHDTHGNHPRRTLMSPSFSAIDMKQALGRCYRAGTKTPVIQNLLFIKGTVEEYVYKSVQAKIKNIDLINDKDVTPCGI